MTSKEIEDQYNREIAGNYLDRDEIEANKLMMLNEIAFQLAKLNEHFEAVDGAVFGDKREKEKEV